MADVPAMNMIECGGQGAGTLPASFNIVAWNIERCLFPEASADHLRPHAPDIILLSEVDCGMARTAQRHTTAEMAQALGMEYAFCVEFFELGLGGPTEMQFCKDDFNRCGWHGNAVLSRVPFEETALFRLSDDGHWFVDGAADPKQPRIGERMAIAARVPTEAGPVVVISTHLESNAGAAHRDGQMRRLLAMTDVFADGAPVIIGGDLNTGNQLENADWRRETLFDVARDAGYSWDANPDGMTTAPSLITPHPTRAMKLDWFCARGLALSDGTILSNMSQETPLSDHLPIIARATLG